MNSDQLMSLVRSVLLGFGTPLITSGVIGTTEQWTAIVGGLMAVAAVLWSQLHHAQSGGA